MPAPGGLSAGRWPHARPAATIQAGPFHDQAQIVAVLAGWRSLQRRRHHSRGGGRNPCHSVRAVSCTADRERTLFSFFSGQDHPGSKGKFISVGNQRTAPSDWTKSGLRRDADYRSSAHEQIHASFERTNLVIQDESSLGDVAEQLGYSPDGFACPFGRSVVQPPPNTVSRQPADDGRSMIREVRCWRMSRSQPAFLTRAPRSCFCAKFGTTPAAYRSGVMALN